MIEYITIALLDTFKVIIYGLLPIIAGAFIMQILSNAIRVRLASFLGIKGYIYLTFLGVIIHELSHAFLCMVFLHKIVDMRLFSPEADGTLGYVNHSYNTKSLYQKSGNFFIGIAPVFGGLIAMFLISKILLPNEMMEISSWHNYISQFSKCFFSKMFWYRWQSWVWIYLLLSIVSHITLSPADLKGAFAGLLSLIIFILILNLSLNWLVDFSNMLLNFLGIFFQYSIVWLGGTIILLFFLILTLKLIRIK